MRAVLLFFMCLVRNNLTGKKSNSALVNLGNDIADRLKNSTKDYGESLPEDFHKYFSMLDEVNNLIHSKNGDEVCKGMAVFDDVEEFGGPPHINPEINVELLEQKINKKKTHDIRTVIRDTKELWKSMEERANRLRHGIPDSETEEHEHSTSDSSEDHLA